MKKLLLSLAVAILAVSPAAAQTTPQQYTLTLGWQEVVQLPACSKTTTPPVTTMCSNGWNVKYTTPASPTPVVAATGLPAVPLSYTFPVPTNNTYATWNWYVDLSWTDIAGNAQTTADATCGTSNTPAPCAIPMPYTVPGPTGLTYTITAVPAS